MAEDLTQNIVSQPEIEEKITSLGINFPSEKPKKLKLLLAILGIFFIFASISAAVFLTKKRQEIRKEAACPGEGAPCNGLTGTHCNTSSCCEHTCKPDGTWGPGTYCGNACKNHPECAARCGGGGGGGGTPTSPPGQRCPIPGGGLGETCSNLNKCDIAGGCNPACCASNSDCPAGTYCSIPNGYCQAGKSCAATTEHHKECRDQQCVEVPGGGPDQCTSHTQCRGITVTPAQCPFDVTPYVKQIAGDVSGLYLCNAYSPQNGCLKLELPPEFAHCTFLAEAYTDSPQQCYNQEKNLRVRRTIGNGGTICLKEFDWGSDCMAQIDIRADQGGAPAGNLKAYKTECGGPPPPPPSLSCNGLTRSPSGAVKVGDVLTLTCSGTNASYFNYRYQVDNGQWQQPSNFQRVSGAVQFTVPADAAGKTFTFECQACRSDNTCTSWGNAQ